MDDERRSEEAKEEDEEEEKRELLEKRAMLIEKSRKAKEKDDDDDDDDNYYDEDRQPSIILPLFSKHFVLLPHEATPRRKIENYASGSSNLAAKEQWHVKMNADEFLEIGRLPPSREEYRVAFNFLVDAIYRFFHDETISHMKKVITIDVDSNLCRFLVGFHELHHLFELDMMFTPPRMWGVGSGRKAIDGLLTTAYDTGWDAFISDPAPITRNIFSKVAKAHEDKIKRIYQESEIKGYSAGIHVEMMRPNPSSSGSEYREESGGERGYYTKVCNRMEDFFREIAGSRYMEYFFGRIKFQFYDGYAILERKSSDPSVYKQRIMTHMQGLLVKPREAWGYFGGGDEEEDVQQKARKLQRLSAAYHYHPLLHYHYHPLHLHHHPPLHHHHNHYHYPYYYYYSH